MGWRRLGGIAWKNYKRNFTRNLLGIMDIFTILGDDFTGLYIYQILLRYILWTYVLYRNYTSINMKTVILEQQKNMKIICSSVVNGPYAYRDLLCSSVNWTSFGGKDLGINEKGAHFTKEIFASVEGLKTHLETGRNIVDNGLLYG